MTSVAWYSLIVNDAPNYSGDQWTERPIPNNESLFTHQPARQI